MLGCRNLEDETTNISQSSPTRQALLLGTFHYNNPGQDVAKTKGFDILGEPSQLELDSIAAAITRFQPTHIFVEWPHNEQFELDSLLNLHRQGRYFANVLLNDFYRKNEIFQLAFRVASLKENIRISGVDYYGTEFPFDSMMRVISEAQQEKLQDEFQEGIQRFTSDFDAMIEQGANIAALTRHLNSPEMRKRSNAFHNQLPLLAGDDDNFIGPLLTAEWYKRNLFMWSLIQKKTKKHQEERVMILLGASHVAMIADFMEDHPQWEGVEFSEIYAE